jgi:ribosomal protein S18 acetylase RimI-like enzyme
MKRQTKLPCKVTAKLKIGIGFGTTQPMMKVRDVEHKAQLPAPVNQRAQQRNRICPARKPDGQPHSRPQQRCVDRKHGKSTHDWMIRRGTFLKKSGSAQPVQCAFRILYTQLMLETRRATVDDAELITRHRKAMFADMRDAPDSILDEMAHHFEPWVRRMLTDAKYAGWIISDADRDIASAGLLILDWAPHFLDPAGEQRGYILNVFVEPEYRRRGLAQALMTECMDEARRRAIRIVALHASEKGQPIYRKLGFTTSNEMLYRDLPH